MSEKCLSEDSEETGRGLIEKKNFVGIYLGEKIKHTKIFNHRWLLGLKQPSFCYD
jgi:hypothetical protein